MQAALRDGRFILKKVGGAENPTNVLTKPLGYRDFADVLPSVGASLVRRA